MSESDQPSDEGCPRSLQQENNTGSNTAVEGHAFSNHDLPPPPPPPRPKRASSRRGDNKAQPQFPTTIEITTPPSRIFANRIKKQRDEYSYSTAGEDGSTVNYESFHLRQASLGGSTLENESIEQRKQTTNTRGQVLVHYHPQLGDEGYESTLLDDDIHAKIHQAKRQVRESGAPLSHIYSGMHSRPLDQTREAEYHYGEDNNAASRQLRRRVFRVAMEGNQYESRRKKLLDADMDIGGPGLKDNSASISIPSGSEVKEEVVNAAQSAGVPEQKEETKPPVDEVDQPFARAPIKPIATSPPSPPKAPPSYRSIVASLINSNEPDKLLQIDKVMDKYAGREEELIKKLDMRYRRMRSRKSQSEQETTEHDVNSPSVGTRTSADGDAAAGGHLPTHAQPAQSNEAHPEPIDELTIQKTDSKIGREVQIDSNTGDEESVGLTSPKRLMFIKVEPKNRPDMQTPVHSQPQPNQPSLAKGSGIVAIQSWDRSEGNDEDSQNILSPPHVVKKSTITALQDNNGLGVFRDRQASSTTQVQSNVSSQQAEVEEDNAKGTQIDTQKIMNDFEDDIPLLPKVDPSLIVQPEDLSDSVENQVVNEHRLKGEYKETISPPKSSPVNLSNDYKLKPTDSYGDGISIITMDTKDTKHIQRAAIAQNEDNFSFEKRPPNSITLAGKGDSGGSETLGKNEKSELLKAVSDGDRTVSNEMARSTSLKIDNVEARIKVRHEIMKEEAQLRAFKTMGMADDDDEVEDPDRDMPSLGEGDDQSSFVGRSLRAATPQVNNMKAIDDEQGCAVGNEHTQVAAQQKSEPTVSSSMVERLSGATVLEEEVTRLLAEKESRLQAEKAAALIKAQREVEIERRARLEAEAARRKAEEELERLKSCQLSTAISAPIVEKQRIDVDRPLATIPTVRAAAVPDDATVSSIVSTARQEAEAARAKAEMDLARLKEYRTRNVDEYAEDELMTDGNVQVGKRDGAELKYVDYATVEAEAARHLKRLEADRKAAEKVTDQATEPETNDGEGSPVDEGEVEAIIPANASNDLAGDEVEKFRMTYSKDENDNKQDETSGTEKCVDSHGTENDVAHQSSIAEVLESLKSDSPVAVYETATDESTRIHAHVSNDRTCSTAQPLEEEHTEHTEHTAAATESVAEERIGKEEDEGSPRIEKSFSQEILESSNRKAKATAEHDFPSTTMTHAPVAAAAAADDSNEDDETQVHHIARENFEGDPSKGQLSFTKGSKIEAHSNQRGPWWLGRCEGRTGWFPAVSVVPASEFMANVVGLSKPIGIEDEERDGSNPMTEEELQETYDMIRSPSDDLSNDASGDSPAKSRWLESKETPGSRSSSPPLVRHDPSKMAGLSQRLYENSEAVSTDAPSQDPSQSALSAAGGFQEPEDIVGDLLRMMNEERQSDKAHHEELKPARLDVTNEQQVWRAAKDPKTGLIYYFHVKTKEVRQSTRQVFSIYQYTNSFI